MANYYIIITLELNSYFTPNKPNKPNQTKQTKQTKTKQAK